MTSRAPQSVTAQTFRFRAGETSRQFWSVCREFFGVPVDFRQHRSGRVATCLFAVDAHRIAFGQIRQPVARK